MSDKIIKIGGASGFWGDADRSTPQLLATEQLDYLVYDYLAEITMSIMARARAKDPSKGYAIDFVSSAMARNLAEIAKQGVKVISNAGGVNPQACADALRQQITEQGLDLKVACVLGDDLLEHSAKLATQDHSEMFTGVKFPDADRLQSINAYLGAFPIAQALELGADIVITGRCVDSAVTLGACIHSFAWQTHEFDCLAMGSLAGHILECGPQATGGNFTDWQQVVGSIENTGTENTGIENIGYPIAEINSDGSFICTKPAGTGGIVTVGTVAEQMLYEIGDPQAYLLPDVSCDFSEVSMTQLSENRVLVEGAIGRPASDTYKVCATYADQFRGGTFLTFYGIDADKKANSMAEAVFRGARNTFALLGMEDFSETSVELIGNESQYGDFSRLKGSREVAMKIAVKHPDAAGIGIMLKEIVGLGLATPPGLSGFQGARAKPSPVVRLFSFVLPKSGLDISIDIDGDLLPVSIDIENAVPVSAIIDNLPRADLPAEVETTDLHAVPLVDLAWGRSGDKGNKANIGIIARKQEYFPYIWAALSEDAVRARLSHFLEDGAAVTKYQLPGLNALNFLLDAVLGGGGMASIRNDAQGKGFAQLLLDMPIPIPRALLTQAEDNS